MRTSAWPHTIIQQPLLGNGSVNMQISLTMTVLQQKNGIFYAVNAEILNVTASRNLVTLGTAV
jgi:hypothetical protein